MNGYSRLGMTNTELGDRVEAAIAALPGWKALVGKSATGHRQGAFDLEAPDGRWVEVKACAESAAEWKVKPKAHEVRVKVAAAARAGREMGVAIAVVSDDLRARVYLRPGLGAFRLPRDGRGWELIGEVAI